MSLFAKECLLRHPSPFQTTRVLNQLFAIPRSSRQLSSSPLLRSVKKPTARKPNPPKSKPSVPLSKPRAPNHTSPKTPSPSSANTTPRYISYADQLAAKTHPTLLYSAPSNALFKFFSYTGAFFCIAYSGYNIYVHYLHPPPDLAKWVVYSFGGIAIFMSGFGTWLFLGPAKMIKTITAIPKRLEVPNVNSLTRGARKAEVEIEVELSKMFPVPFFPARKLLVRPDEISLSQPLTPPLPPNLTPAERHALHEAEKQDLKDRQEYEDSHIMTRPFRHFGRGAKAAYTAAARTWLREGFVNAKIQGGNHKLDVSGGWALDGGRALDRLVVVKPRAPGSWLS